MKHKKIMVLILAIVMIIASCTVFALDGAVTSDKSQTYFKIGVLYGSTAPETAAVECENGLFVASISKDGWTFKRDLGYKKLIVRNVGNHVVAMSEDDSFSYVLSGEEAIMAYGRTSDEMILSVNGTKYRDGVTFNAIEGGKLTVISYVCAEHYIWGVVSSEMSYKKASEALKVMAVCARSFAYIGSNKHASQGFDLCNTSCCQVYKPVTLEYDSIINACKATKDMVLTYQGKVVSTYYFSHSSGHTLNSEDVWVATIPYARGVEDEYTSKYDWSFIFTFEEIEKILENRGINLGKIQKVSISQMGEYGAVTAITVEGTEGSREFSKSTMKSVFSLKSQTFTISGEISDETYSYSQSNEDKEEYVCVLGADGNMVKVVASGLSNLVVSNGETEVSGGEISWDGMTNKEEMGYSTTGIVFFNGTGSGHGVGCCITGAQNMANKGMNYIDILNYYFTDTEVKAYER